MLHGSMADRGEVWLPTFDRGGTHKMRSYYIIEHPTRGVFVSFIRDRMTDRQRPAFANDIKRENGAWLANHAHALRTLALIRKYGVKQCYILKASPTTKGDVVFTQDNERQA